MNSIVAYRCEFPCYNDASSLDSLDNDGWEDEPNDRDEEEVIYLHVE